MNSIHNISLNSRLYGFQHIFAAKAFRSHNSTIELVMTGDDV